MYHHRHRNKWLWGGFVMIAGACGGTEENCEIINYSPSSNLYNITYDLHLPHPCPVPLSQPAYETKYASGSIIDGGSHELDFALLTVINSDDEEIAESETTLFNNGHAAPFAEYTAATGDSTFADHDIGKFVGFDFGAQALAWGEVKIVYQQSSLSTSLDGPSIPAGNTATTWYAPTDGGTQPYSYQWYRDGTAVGSGYSYTASTGSTDFNLRVEVTDDTWSTGAAVLFVDVDGVDVQISGPSNVYLSEGGGTWTASGSGGTGSYSFAWYVDDEYLGSGSSWSGYPGQYRNTLRVEMTDSNGAIDGDVMEVTGIGDPDEGGCVPEPPAIIC